MPITQRIEGYPFSGARSIWTRPIEDNYWLPKVWGTEATYVDPPGWFDDLSARFIDDGVIFGDILFICNSSASTQSEHTVNGVISNTRLSILPAAPGGIIDILYKVGLQTHHTLDTLGRIINARGLFPYSIHWVKLWTGEQAIKFSDDQYGDIYCIDPPGGGKLQALKDKWDEDNPGSLEPNPWDSLNPRPGKMEP